MKSPDMNLETSVSANGDGAGVRCTEGNNPRKRGEYSRANCFQRRGFTNRCRCGGPGYVSTFLGLGVVLLQVAMLMNMRQGLPTRAVKHLQTVCR